MTTIEAIRNSGGWIREGSALLHYQNIQLATCIARFDSSFMDHTYLMWLISDLLVYFHYMTAVPLAYGCMYECMYVLCVCMYNACQFVCSNILYMIRMKGHLCNKDTIGTTISCHVQ